MSGSEGSGVSVGVFLVLWACSASVADSQVLETVRRIVTSGTTRSAVVPCVPQHFGVQRQREGRTRNAPPEHLKAATNAEQGLWGGCFGERELCSLADASAGPRSESPLLFQLG